LNSQNIGLNYKGILNLNTLNGNLSGTLQAVTDGDGNASLLQLSTTEVAIPTGIFTVDAQMRFNGTIYNTIDDIVKFGGAIRTATFASIGGTFTNSARLHVRGDGTNPIARFDNNAGTSIFTIGSSGSITATGDYIISAAYSAFIHGSAYYGSTNGGAGGLGNSNDINGSVSNQDAYATYIRNQSTFSRTSGTQGILTIGTNTFAAGAGSANFRPLNIAYTINNSGAQTGTATGIFLNATETALNGMTHNLMDLGTGGGTYVSRFLVGRTHDIAFTFNENADRFGLFTISRVGSPTTPALFIGTGSGPTGTQGRIACNGDDLALGTVASGTFTERLIITTSNLIALGGTTNAFPAIKRNAAMIDFRLADDSAFCNIRAGRLDLTGALLTGFINDATNAITAILIANTTGKTTFAAPLAATALPTTRPATVGDLYVDTAANILANGDKIVAIRV
jgi:hypothetical protein